MQYYLVYNTINLRILDRIPINHHTNVPQCNKNKILLQIIKA